MRWLDLFCATLALIVVVLWGVERQSTPPSHWMDWLWFASIILAIVLWVISVTRPDPREIRKIPLSALVAAAIIVGGILAYEVYDKNNTTPMVAMIGATMATIGWIALRENSIFLNRKQHTLNVLLQIRQSEAFNKHRTHILSHYPTGTNITAADLPELLKQRKDKTRYVIQDGKETQFPVAESIQFVANFYEFLAAAVKQRDLDERLLYETLGDIIVAYYEKILPILLDHQKPNKEGVPTTGVFTQYHWLYHRWVRRDAAEDKARAKARERARLWGIPGA